MDITCCGVASSLSITRNSGGETSFLPLKIAFTSISNILLIASLIQKDKSSLLYSALLTLSSTNCQSNRRSQYSMLFLRLVAGIQMHLAIQEVVIFTYLLALPTIQSCLFCQRQKLLYTTYNYLSLKSLTAFFSYLSALSLIRRQSVRQEAIIPILFSTSITRRLILV